jgi:hypothetical protein
LTPVGRTLENIYKIHQMAIIASHISQGPAVSAGTALPIIPTGEACVRGCTSSHALTVGVDAVTTAFWNTAASGSDVSSSSHISCPKSDEDAACFSLSQAGSPIRTNASSVRSGGFAATAKFRCRTQVTILIESHRYEVKPQALSSSSVQSAGNMAQPAVMLAVS